MYVIKIEIAIFQFVFERVASVPNKGLSSNYGQVSEKMHVLTA